MLNPVSFLIISSFSINILSLIKLEITMVVWQRLIRFVATDGRILRGEPILPTAAFDLGNTTAETKLQAKVIVGADIYDTTGNTKVTDEIVTVKELLGPLAQEDVPILRCVGLNYAKHSKWKATYRSKSYLTREPLQSKKPVALHPLSPSSFLSQLRALQTTMRTS